MNKKKIVVSIIILSLFLVSTISAFSIFPRPVVNNTFFPDTFFIFNFSFVSDTTGVLLSNQSNLSTDASGIAFTNINISSLSIVPDRFIHRRDGIIVQNSTFDDKIFKRIIAKSGFIETLNITELEVNGINISDINNTFLLQTDQRYNETDKLNSINTTINIQKLINNTAGWILNFTNIFSNDWTNISGLTDSQISDTLTIDGAGAVTWSALTSYPSACATSETLTTIGDTLTCSSISITESQISDLQNYAINNTAGWILNFTNIFSLDWTNVSITESQISDLQIYALNTTASIQSLINGTSLNLTSLISTNISVDNLLSVSGNGIKFWDNLDLQGIFNITALDWIFAKNGNFTNINVTDITATNYFGDGSQLTGIVHDVNGTNLDVELINGIKTNLTTDGENDTINIYTDVSGSHRSSFTQEFPSGDNLFFSDVCPIEANYHPEEGSALSTLTSGGLQFSYGNGNLPQHGPEMPCNGYILMMSMDCENSGATDGRVQMAKDGVALGTACQVSSTGSNFASDIDKSCSSLTFNAGDQLTPKTTTSSASTNGCTVHFYVRFTSP